MNLTLFLNHMPPFPLLLHLWITTLRLVGRLTSISLIVRFLGYGNDLDPQTRMGKVLFHGSLTYLALVHEFYCSMACGYKDIMCTIKGVTFGPSSRRCSEIWGLLLEGVNPKHPINQEIALKIVLERDDVRGITNIFAN